jgi:hypothetical protein
MTLPTTSHPLALELLPMQCGAGGGEAEEGLVELRPWDITFGLNKSESGTTMIIMTTIVLNILDQQHACNTVESCDRVC